MIEINNTAHVAKNDKSEFRISLEDAGFLWILSMLCKCVESIDITIHLFLGDCRLNKI